MKLFSPTRPYQMRQLSRLPSREFCPRTPAKRSHTVQASILQKMEEMMENNCDCLSVYEMEFVCLCAIERKREEGRDGGRVAMCFL